MKEKNEFYNNVDIWMAPTMSEGLHLPPAEAALTECPVVGTKTELAGIQDYIIPNVSGLLSKNDLRSFMRDVERMYINRDYRAKFGKEARKQVFAIGNRRKNMKKLVELIGSLK